MSAVYVFASLKAHMKARGITYEDLSQALNVSEVTVKRIFSQCDCSVERLIEICNYLQIHLTDVVQGAPKPQTLIAHLTWEQEIEFVENKKLLLVAICALSRWRFEEIVCHFKLDEAECMKLFSRLEKMGFLAWQPNNLYRLQVAADFAWIVSGPLMRFVSKMADEYFAHDFQNPGELLRITNLRVSHQSRERLKEKLEQVVKDYALQMVQDSYLPLEERPPVSICVAARLWVPKFMRDLLRPEQMTKVTEPKMAEVLARVTPRAGR